MTDYRNYLDQQVSEVVVDINDFGKRFLQPIQPNEKVYTLAAKNYANARYEDFFQNVLKPNADAEGRIVCGKAALLWEIFIEKQLCIKYFECSAHLKNVFDENVVKFWLKEFERPVEELFHYTSAIISTAYYLITEYHKDWLIKQKYEKVYSTSNDYAVLVDKLKMFKEITKQEIKYDMRMIGEKVKTMIDCKI